MYIHKNVSEVIKSFLKDFPVVFPARDGYYMLKEDEYRKVSALISEEDKKLAEKRLCLLPNDTFLASIFVIREDFCYSKNFANELNCVANDDLFRRACENCGVVPVFIPDSNCFSRIEINMDNPKFYAENPNYNWHDFN